MFLKKTLDDLFPSFLTFFSSTTNVMPKRVDDRNDVLSGFKLVAVLRYKRIHWTVALVCSNILVIMILNKSSNIFAEQILAHLCNAMLK